MNMKILQRVAVALFFMLTLGGWSASVEDLISRSEGDILRDGEALRYPHVLTHYILRYNPDSKKLSVIRREKPQRVVQKIEGIQSMEHEIPYFQSVDINLDGFEDIAFVVDCGYNCASAYLVFDPQSGQFMPNEVDIFAQAVTPDKDARILTAHTATGLASWTETIYAPDGHDFPVLQSYSYNAQDADYFEDETSAGYRFSLAEAFYAIGAQSGFRLAVQIDYQYSSDEAEVGHVVYRGENEKITRLRFRHAEILERTEAYTPKTVRHSFEEWDSGKHSGEYSFILENGKLKEGRYIRWKDRQSFVLRPAPQAAATRPDCRQAKSPVEKTLCASLDLHQLDARMSVVYAELWEEAPEARRALLQEQKAWLIKRDACEEDKNCLDQEYQERISTLRAQLATLSPDAPDETDLRALAELRAKVEALRQTAPVFPLEHASSAFAPQPDRMTYFGNERGDTDGRAHFPETRPDGVSADEWRALLASEVEIAVDSEYGDVGYTLLDLDGDGLRDFIIDAYTGGTGLFSYVTLLRRKGTRFEYPALEEDYFYFINGRGSNQESSWIHLQGRIYALYRDGHYGTDRFYLLRPFRQNLKVPVLTVRYRYQFFIPETQYDKDTHKPVTLEESLRVNLTRALSPLNDKNFTPSGEAAEAPICPIPPEGIDGDAVDAYIFGAGYYAIELVHDFPVWLQGKCHPARLMDWFGRVDEKGELLATLCLKNPPSDEENCYAVKARRYAVEVESGLGARWDK
ncbi:MAG: lysozyme inhibitor LprI family protein [Zoogloeaceae bacterium]|jgi:uncharacterized protein YecT (DUF1311 family)|nr:lysozyme inhibitor LprI family protein [Zoogloeaceae bacterium]